MENKVFYGEYTLAHWINLILKGNIKRPWYQRAFVWNREQIIKLISSLDNDQFVPPIIIGAVKEKGEWINYILDGQQRLTSILFAWCNKYIDKKEYAFQKPSCKIDNIADDIVENEDDSVDEEIKMIKWNFEEIIEKKQLNNKELERSFYKELFSDKKDNAFFNDHYLGFAYIKPKNNIKEEEQSKFYSDIFRNINTGGTQLTRLETRKSLYFLKEDLKDFFAPEFLETTKVVTSSKENGLIDFIKYLSIIAQYKSRNSLSKYGGRTWEKNEIYYRKYIMSVVNNNSNNDFNFDVSYPASPYDNTRMVRLKDTMSNLNFPNTFNSIIDMDMYFFGLVYVIIFMNEQLDDTRKDNLKAELEQKIRILKNTENHRFNPNALKYLNARIKASLEVYKKYSK